MKKFFATTAVIASGLTTFAPSTAFAGNLDIFEGSTMQVQVKAGDRGNWVGKFYSLEGQQSARGYIHDVNDGQDSEATRLYCRATYFKGGKIISYGRWRWSNTAEPGKYVTGNCRADALWNSRADGVRLDIKVVSSGNSNVYRGTGLHEDS